MTVRCECYECINIYEGYCNKERIDVWDGGVCGDYEVSELEEDEQERP